MAKRPQRQDRPDAPSKAKADVASDVLMLDCPVCERPLEVDAGFAGGVCRCWNCGAMMTVPLNPQAERVEKVTRAERPAAPQAAGTEPPAPAAPTPTAEEEFVTESGKHIHVRRTRIAASRKARVGVKVAVIAAFVGFMGLIIAGTVVAIWVMSRGDDEVPVDVQAIDADLRGYDPELNPFTFTDANVLGIKLKSPVAVVLDASYGNRAWYDLAKEAVAVGLGRGGVTGQVLIAHDGGVEVYPSEPGKLDPAGLKAFVESYAPSGRVDLPAAVARALGGSPAHVVLVGGAELGEAVAGAMSVPKVRYDAVYIATPPDPSVEATVRKSGGRAISISRVQLENWYFDQ